MKLILFLSAKSDSQVFISLTGNMWRRRLINHQEEADNKVFLCAKHAVTFHAAQSVIIHTVDSDISIYSLFTSNQSLERKSISKLVWKSARASLKFPTSSQSSVKIVVCTTRIYRNDYTSAFFGNGKAKALKILRDSEEFVETFGKFGDATEFDEGIFKVIQNCVCKLYGVKAEDVNHARFLKFTATKLNPPPQKLPPTRDALLCHCKRFLT